MASRGINKVTVLGNVGNDPEVRATSNGLTVVNVSLATNITWRDKNTGEAKERTEWHRIVFFNKLADIVKQYVRKGSLIYVEGRLQTDSWTDNKTGEKRYATRIIANEMQMLDTRRGSKDDDTYSQRDVAHNSENASAVSADVMPSHMEDDDIPF